MLLRCTYILVLALIFFFSSRPVTRMLHILDLFAKLPIFRLKYILFPHLLSLTAASSENVIHRGMRLGREASLDEILAFRFVIFCSSVSWVGSPGWPCLLSLSSAFCTAFERWRGLEVGFWWPLLLNNKMSVAKWESSVNTLPSLTFPTSQVSTHPWVIHHV